VITKADDSQETQQVTINVGGSGCGDPYITRFSPTTSAVSSGQPFSIFWDVDCATTVHFIQVGTSEEPVGGHSQKIDVRIYADTTFQLRVGKTGGGFAVASFVVKLK
jgi:hypothetical protein